MAGVGMIVTRPEAKRPRVRHALDDLRQVVEDERLVRQLVHGISPNSEDHAARFRCNPELR